MKYRKIGDVGQIDEVVRTTGEQVHELPGLRLEQGGRRVRHVNIQRTPQRHVHHYIK